MAVADDWDYVFVRKPNVFSFAVESDPKAAGFGDYYDLPHGLYRITYACRETRDWKTGIIDGWWFTAKKIERITDDTISLLPLLKFKLKRMLLFVWRRARR